MLENDKITTRSNKLLFLIIASNKITFLQPTLEERGENNARKGVLRQPNMLINLFDILQQGLDQAFFYTFLYGRFDRVVFVCLFLFVCLFSICFEWACQDF